MRSLAVRVSAIKNSDNQKKQIGELRILVLNLPKTQIFDVPLNDSDATACLEAFKDEYSKATGADQQLAMINSMIRHFTRDDQWILNDEVLGQILSDLHFHAPLKHPIRNAIVKVLQKEAIRKRGIVSKSIRNSVQESNEALMQLLDERSIGLDTDAMKDFIQSLGGHFDNFSEGATALEPYCLTLLQTLERLIDIYMDILRNDNLSPAKRSEFFIDLHNVIRVLLSCVQQYQSQISNSDIIQPVLTQCWVTLMDDPQFFDLPMDTKVNCGILKVLHNRRFENIFAPRANILTQFKGTSLLSKDLFYGIAIINTISNTDFSDPNFYVAIKEIIDRLIKVGSEYTMDSCIVMVVIRTLVQFSKKLLGPMRKLNSQEFEEPLNINFLKLASQNCLKYVWLNVQHSLDCARYLTYELLRNLLRLGHEHSNWFGELVNETIVVTKSSSTNESLVCLLLDYLCQVLNTEHVLKEIPDIQERMLKNLFKDTCWSNSYERVMLTNCNEIDFDLWCERWIQPLLQVDPIEWRNDFTRLKTIRNLFERAMKTKAEAADYILLEENISIEIYLFVLWTMRRSGRKKYSPENFDVATNLQIRIAKSHPLDEVRILAFRTLIECHKISERFTEQDLKEILEFVRYNCNSQNPTMRQQIATTMRSAMRRIECGYAGAKRERSVETHKLCTSYEVFLKDMIENSTDDCLFIGANFGRRSVGLSVLLICIETWQKLQPQNKSIYSDKLNITLQRTLSDSYVVNKDTALDILSLCWKYYVDKPLMIFTLDELKRLVTTFRPYDTMTAAHYLVFCAMNESYFRNYYEAIIWCEKCLDEGLEMAKVSLMQAARHNALFGSLLTIRHLFGRVDFTKITSTEEVENWRSFFERIIPKWRELTNVVAPIVNSSAPEGHLPSDLNDESHFLTSLDNEGKPSGSQIKLTPQIILLCAWRTVRESSLLLGDIALRTPVITANNHNGLISVGELLKIGLHFQHLLAVTKHRGAFEQTFVGFTNLCLRLWKSNESELHNCPMQLIKKIAAVISGETVENDGNAVLDLNKLCATRRSAGIPFMIQGIVATEVQVCSSVALTFCMTKFLEISKNGPVEEARTHSLNILRALFKCTELGEAVSEYISDGIECSIRSYSAASWPERNSATLLFSALITRVFGVQRTKEIENVSMKNKMTGRVFFMRHPKLYDFFYTELKSASEAIQRNDRPPRLHPLLLIISRLYPSALEGCDSNLKLSTYIPFISACSSSPELVTRQLSAKSMTALISPENIPDHLSSILSDLKQSAELNAIHGYLLQIFYLLRSAKQQEYHIDVKVLREFLTKLTKVDLPQNNVLLKTLIEILIEILLNEHLHPLELSAVDELAEVRSKYLKSFANPTLYNQLTRSYVQKPFTLFNFLLSTCHNTSIDELGIVSVPITNTQTELLETQLNVWHLLLLQKCGMSIAGYDFSRNEIELVKFVGDDTNRAEILLSLLPSVSYLYHIIENEKEYYPFGVVKSYEILGIILGNPNEFDKKRELKEISIDEVMEMIKELSKMDEIDEITEPKWKYINAQILHHTGSNEKKLLKTDEINLLMILSIIRRNTQPHKSASLRQIATNTLTLLIPTFMGSNISIDNFINLMDLVLRLLRDDDLDVRNQNAKNVMVIIHDVDNSLSPKRRSDQLGVLPSFAEDRLLVYLGNAFRTYPGNGHDYTPRTLWWKLLKMMSKGWILDEDEEKEPATNGKTPLNDDENDNLVDVDIFEPDEQNTFDESIYTLYKCCSKLLESTPSDDLSEVKEEMLKEFPSIGQFFASD